MLDVLDSGDLWSLHLFNQAQRDARTQQIGERLRRQLAIETNRLLRPFYDTVVEEVAVTGSDLFAAEGSDVTLLFRAKQPDMLKKRMDGFLDNAVKSRPDAKRREGEFLGVRYVQVSSPERDIHVFSAYPEPGSAPAQQLETRHAARAGGDQGQDLRRQDRAPPRRQHRVRLHPHAHAARREGGRRFYLPVRSVYSPSGRPDAQADRNVGACSATTICA